MTTAKAPSAKPTGQRRQALHPATPYRGDASESALAHELAVLGCLVTYPEDATAAFGSELEPELFSAPRRLILESAGEVLAVGDPLNIVTLTDQLRNRGNLEKVGGPAEISQLLTKHECSPTVAAHSLYQLREHAARRIGAETGTWLASVTANGSFDSGAVVEEMLRRTEEITRLSAGRRKSDLPEIEDLDDLIAEEVPEPPELVEGILHQGSKMVIGGGSKSFKTWLLTDLGLSVATGKEWLGFATTRGRVLYINLEIQRPFFRKRVKAIGAEKAIGRTNGMFEVWNLRGFAADLSTLLPRLLKGMAGKRYTLIIIDPIYKVLGEREENAAGDITNLLNELERLAVETGAAVVFGAHFSKGNQAGKESLDRIGGSGVYARDPDTIMVLTKHEEDDAFTVDSTLRNHPPVEPFVVRWQHPLMTRDGGLDPAKLKQAGGRAKEHEAKDLLKLLGVEELTSTEWQKLAAEESGISRRTFYRILKEAEAARIIKKSPLTGKWIQTSSCK